MLKHFIIHQTLKNFSKAWRERDRAIITKPSQDSKRGITFAVLRLVETFPLESDLVNVSKNFNY